MPNLGSADSVGVMSHGLALSASVSLARLLLAVCEPAPPVMDSSWDGAATDVPMLRKKLRRVAINESRLQMGCTYEKRKEELSNAGE